MPEVDRRAENWDDFQISNLEILLALHSMDRLPRTGPRLSCELLDLVRAGRGGADRGGGLTGAGRDRRRPSRHWEPGARARAGCRCRSRAPTVLDVTSGRRVGTPPAHAHGGDAAAVRGRRPSVWTSRARALCRRSPSLPAAAVAPAEGGGKAMDDAPTNRAGKKRSEELRQRG